MSFSYDRYDRQQRSRRGGSSFTAVSSRSTLGYWVPLIVTITAATVGVAAWIWSERQDGGEDDEYAHEQRRRRRREERTQSPPLAGSYHNETRNEMSSSSFVDVTSTEQAGSEWRAEDEAEAEGILAKMSGAIRRTPSPQKMFDYASKRVAAGVAAAGAVAGRGLSAITEEEGKADDFVDHERWTEEQKVQGLTRSADGSIVQASSAAPIRGRRKTVAVVVCADSGNNSDMDSSHANIDRTSVLANISSQVDPTSTDLLILIYAPQLKNHPLSNQATSRRSRRTSSGGSSYDNIPTPGTEAGTFDGLTVSDAGDDIQSSAYNTIASQALSLVEHPTSVLPFTTPGSHVHMLRHLSPNLVYLQESLAGPNGENVKEISGWVGQVVVLLGAGGVGAAIVDTETEDEGPGHNVRKQRWWMDEGRVGLGKGVDVVESVKFGEDWKKRAGK